MARHRDPALERYLLDGERVVVAMHQHWGKVAGPVAAAVAGLVLALWVHASVGPSWAGVVRVTWIAWLVLCVWTLWQLFEWRHDWFVATDKRLLLTYGLISRRVAMMPLTKVTDMSYSRSVPGRILGYGQFIMESAGQDQALHDINWVPDPDHTYRAICAEMFGVDDHDRVRVGSDDDTAASTTGEDPAHLAPDPSWSDPSWSDPSWSDASRSAVVEDHGSHSRAIPVHRLDAEGRSSHRSDERRRPGAGADTGPLPVIRPRGDD